MARPLQKKKNKSSLPRVRQRPKSKRINIHSNPIVAKNWDRNLTLVQNYRRLGLSSKLNNYTGGTEVHETPPSTVHPRKNLLAIPSSRKPTDLGIAEVKVVRDPKTGAILSVQHSKPARDNPLGDPLNELSDAEDENSGGKIERGERGIVADLEEMVKCGKPKRPRMQSQREREWIERLVKRWGDDWGGMFRDRRMNPQQQTEGDLKRRVGVWKAAKRKGGQGED